MRAQKFPVAAAVPVMTLPCTALSLTSPEAANEHTWPFHVPRPRPTVVPSPVTLVSATVTVPVRWTANGWVTPPFTVSVPGNVSVTDTGVGPSVGLELLPQALVSAAADR